jgi:Plasmid pRiA4b ORF-3-like protein
VPDHGPSRGARLGTVIAPNTLAGPVVYQLRVWLLGVSPMVWRRLLVQSDTTLAELHETLQVAMGWTDTHLHRFRIHGREFAIPRLGDAGLDDARQVRLSQFGFRPRERFLYEYDFTDAWQHEVRIEAIQPVEAGRCYPVCLAGKRSAPPEECGGPWAYLRLRDWLRRRALASLVVLAEDLLARPGGRVSEGSRLSLATADGDADDEALAEDADDPWEIRAELARAASATRYGPLDALAFPHGPRATPARRVRPGPGGGRRAGSASPPVRPRALRSPTAQRSTRAVGPRRARQPVRAGLGVAGEQL